MQNRNKKAKTTYIASMEGIDHFNAYSQSRTELGRLLSNFEQIPIDLPRHGHFESLEGLWFWLKTGDDRLRHMFGYDAKKYGTALNGSLMSPDAQEFRETMLEAMWHKINASARLKSLLTESSLPITHYYVRRDNDGKEFSVPVNGHDWLWEGIESFREYLKRGKSPSRFDLMTQIEVEKETQFQLF